MNRLEQALIAIIAILIIGITIFIILSHKKDDDKKVVVERRYIWGGWPDYGFNTWRRGGAPWGHRGGRHKWRRSGGANVGRP